jgi:hypothetical protein
MRESCTCHGPRGFFVSIWLFQTRQFLESCVCFRYALAYAHAHVMSNTLPALLHCNNAPSPRSSGRHASGGDACSQERGSRA